MRIKNNSNLHLVVNSVINVSHRHEYGTDLVLRNSLSNSLSRELVSLSCELSVGSLVIVSPVSVDSHIRVSVGSVVDPVACRV